jgi:hypothetical protein
VTLTARSPFAARDRMSAPLDMTACKSLPRKTHKT